MILSVARTDCTCRARNAILGPTPGREQRPSTVFGISPSNSSRIFCAACLIYLKTEIMTLQATENQHSPHWVFLLQNPTLPIASDIVASLAANTLSTVNSPRELRKFDTAQCVTSSFVWEESISETRITNLLVCCWMFVQDGN